ncbi:MAG: hypothetical protein WC144_06110 [Sulfurimonas sp.]|jgi:hypothetical protein
MLRHNNPFKKSIGKTLSANAGDEDLALFTVIGSVDILAIYGVVTSGLGAGLTVAYFNLWDGASEVEITDNVGADISSLPAGSVISKLDVATAVVDVVDATNGAVSEDATYKQFRKEFNVTAKAGATTTIRFTYTAAGVASGVIQFFCEYIPRSQGAKLS